MRLYRNDLPKQPVYTWIFDAKYRITEDGYAPSGAINQMHWYRDAILWGKEAPFKRETLGAYVLYPGEKELYKNSIQNVNIGAYVLTPKKYKDQTDSPLREKLKELIVLKKNEVKSYNTIQEESLKYFQSIPEVKNKATGIIAKCKTRFSGDETDRQKYHMNEKEYWDICRLYRLPKSIVDKEKLLIDSWEYIVPVNTKFDSPKALACFPILSCEKKTRKEIIAIYHNEHKIKIRKSSKKDDKIYYLFRLGPKVGIPKLSKISKSKVVDVTEIDKS